RLDETSTHFPLTSNNACCRSLGGVERNASASATSWSVCGRRASCTASCARSACWVNQESSCFMVSPLHALPHWVVVLFRQTRLVVRQDGLQPAHVFGGVLQPLVGLGQLFLKLTYASLCDGVVGIHAASACMGYLP